MDNSRPAFRRRVRHRERVFQTPIYLGKLLRGFVFMNDWKVLPMAAIIAVLVSLVVRNTFFLYMEGTLKGCLALTFVSIWNGCFNSIQVICRERPIVKREHRSGMHISSYIAAHMIYQALLCLAQSVITLYVFKQMGVKFPRNKALITPFIMVDLCITVFLISYASDMISLLVSAIAHSTTAAMTVMPFLLVVQLVLSGGIFSLPSWAKMPSRYTLSSFGIKCIAAQADYNSLPMSTAWNTLSRMKNENIHVDTTIGNVLDLLTGGDQDALEAMRNAELTDDLTFEQSLMLMTANGYLNSHRDDPVSIPLKLGDIIDAFGEDKVKDVVQNKTAAVSRVEDYEYSEQNIKSYWLQMILLAAVCAFLATVSLEFIDKDKR